jgi:hypothetical protein
MDRDDDPISSAVSARHTASGGNKLDGDFIMTNRTKIALAAMLIAGLATPAAAQGLVPYYNYSVQAPSYQTQAQSHATREQRLIEGRNAAAVRSHDSAVGVPMVPDRTTVLGN